MTTATATRYAPSQGKMQIRNFTNATNDDIRAVAPAVFAEARNEERTKPTYQFVSTIQLIEAMRLEGWMVTAAGQRYVRDVNRWASARHFIRMRHESSNPKQELMPEAIIMNAHDGTASWRYFDGAFRGVCTNGLVWGELMGVVKAHHTMRQSGPGGITAMQLSAEFMRALPAKMTIADKLKAIKLSQVQAAEFFTKAIAVRWPHGASITQENIVQAPWLSEDYGLSAWQIYNHAQRWLVTNGGVEGRNINGRTMTTTPIRTVHDTVRVNVGLWNAILDYVPRLEPELRTPDLEPEQV